MARYPYVFVLNTGRCGSMTFIRACEHMSNYSAAHESLLTRTGPARLDFPRHHIEADNRLSWFLGRLDRAFGPQAFYVHMRRQADATARSLARREAFGIMKAYREGILLGGPAESGAFDLALDYVHTVESNIELFLRDKPHRMECRLESIETDFPLFWHRIAAMGDLEGALAEWNTAHNASR